MVAGLDYLCVCVLKIEKVGTYLGMCPTNKKEHCKTNKKYHEKEIITAESWRFNCEGYLVRFYDSVSTSLISRHVVFFFFLSNRV